MVYNKTKRNLEVSASLIECIVAMFVIVVFGVIQGYSFISIWLSYRFVVSQFIFMVLALALGIPWLIFSIICIENPVNKDGSLKKRKGYRIYNIIVSFLAGIAMLIFVVVMLVEIIRYAWVSPPGGGTIALYIIMILISIAILIAGVLHLIAITKKDWLTEEEVRQKEQNKRKNNVSCQVLNMSNQQQTAQLENANKILELKHLKDLGILSEEEYNAKVNEILNNF